MSREKSVKSKHNSSIQLTEDYDMLYTNIRRQNSINSYLKKVSKRDLHHFRELKNITDGYIFDSSLTEKENQNGQLATIRYQPNLEKKIEEIIENKFGKMLESYVLKYVSQVLQDHKTALERFYREHFEEIQQKLAKTEEGYHEMIKNYDQFLKVVDSIREKPRKTGKQSSKLDFEETFKNINLQMNAVKTRLISLEKEQQNLRKSSLPQLSAFEPKIQPILLNYQDKWDLNREELRIVVDTFNQNFIRIDEKLKEIVNYIS